jgi:hypothetical protein
MLLPIGLQDGQIETAFYSGVIGAISFDEEILY